MEEGVESGESTMVNYPNSKNNRLQVVNKKVFLNNDEKLFTLEEWDIIEVELPNDHSFLIEKRSDGYYRKQEGNYHKWRILDSRKEITIGRGVKCVIVVEWNKISREHCTFKTTNGSVVVTDKSGNGLHYREKLYLYPKLNGKTKLQKILECQSHLERTLIKTTSSFYTLLTTRHWTHTIRESNTIWTYRKNSREQTDYIKNIIWTRKDFLIKLLDSWRVAFLENMTEKKLLKVLKQWEKSKYKPLWFVSSPVRYIELLEKEEVKK